MSFPSTSKALFNPLSTSLSCSRLASPGNSLQGEHQVLEPLKSCLKRIHVVNCLNNFFLGGGLSGWPQDVASCITIRGRGTAQGCTVQAEDQPI